MVAPQHDIRVKRIYEAPAGDDGARVLVDRVWPRGVSKEAAALTQWLKEVAPTAELRRWFGHDPARWGEFTRRYHAELNAGADALVPLDAFLKKGRVTLLYSARDTEHNQAVALAAYLEARHR